MTVALLWVVIALVLWVLDKVKAVPQPRTFIVALMWPFDLLRAGYQTLRYIATGRR